MAGKQIIPNKKWWHDAVVNGEYVSVATIIRSALNDGVEKRAFAALHDALAENPSSQAAWVDFVRKTIPLLRTDVAEAKAAYTRFVKLPEPPPTTKDEVVSAQRKLNEKRKGRKR